MISALHPGLALLLGALLLLAYAAYTAYLVAQVTGTLA